MENVIVGIGEILWDVFPNGKVLGGAPANLLIMFRSLDMMVMLSVQ